MLLYIVTNLRWKNIITRPRQILKPLEKKHAQFLVFSYVISCIPDRKMAAYRRALIKEIFFLRWKEDVIWKENKLNW